jgi:hypothetical protein
LIGKINKGKAFAPLVKYVLNPEKNARIVATNMCGVTPVQLIAELKITQDYNLRVRSPVCHISLSFPIGERVSDQTLGSICRDYLPQMGFDNNPYFVAIHEDTDHFHAHIVTSRIKWSGQCVPDWKDYHKSETILRQLEKNYQLTPVTPSWEIQQTADTTGEIRRQRKENKEVKSVRRRLQDAIDLATRNDNVSVSTLFKSLKSQGIEIEVIQTSSGLGISFSLDNINISGTNLGIAYTWNGLQKHRNVNYDPLRDQLAIQQAMEHKTLRLSCEKETQTATSKVINQSPNTLFTVDEKTAYASRKDESRFIEPTHRATTGYESVNQRLAELTALVGNSCQTEQSDSNRTSELKPSTNGDREKQYKNIDSTRANDNSTPARFSLIKHTGQNRSNSADTEANTQLNDDTSTEYSKINQCYESELTRLAELQATARRSIEELEEEHQKRHPNRDRKLETRNQELNREHQSSNPKIQPGYQVPIPRQSRGFER